MADVLRVSILGRIQGGEVWSVNPVWAVEPPGLSISYDDCLAIATAVDALTVPVNLLNKTNNAFSWTGCRVEARTWSGVLEATAEHTRTAALGGSGAGALPLQTTVVSSLRTTHPGASGRGRLYWPANSMPLNAQTGRIGSSDVTATLTAVESYLTDIQNAVQGVVALATLGVWSRKDAAVYQVNRIQMGDIPDVQRRRRDMLNENYTSVPFVD